MNVKIKHKPEKSFIVDVDGHSVQLSYKNFGGRAQVEALGDSGLENLLDSTRQAIANKECPERVSQFFQAAGCENAMKLLAVICPEDFCEYWLSTARALKAAGRGYSFRSTLQFITGTKATLAHANDDFVGKLRKICETVKRETDVSAPTLSSHPDYQIIDADGIRVSYSHANNNTHTFVVNGQTVSFCTNRVTPQVSTEFVWNAASEVRKAVETEGDIKQFTSKWGGSFVFRLMRAVCEDASYHYFSAIAQQQTKERQKIEPRKLLASYNYSFNDTDNEFFINKILSILEDASNCEADTLTWHNDVEVLPCKNVWTLYYSEGGNAKKRMLDFTTINNPVFYKIKM